MIEYRAAANIIFFFSKFLKSMDEHHITTVAGHELAHYYKGHATVLGFDPYFFLQSKNNELRKPTPTNHHSKVQAEMRAISMLSGLPKISGAALEPELFSELNSTVSEYFAFCSVESSCMNTYSKITQIRVNPLFSKLYAIEYRKVPEDVQKLYVDFEVAANDVLKFAELTTLNTAFLESFKTRILKKTKDFESNFAIQETHKNVFDVIVGASKVFTAAKLSMRPVFEKGANLGLGFYSTEEEADEVGLELAARVGVPDKRASSLFQAFHALLLKTNPVEDPRATTYADCKEMRRSNWVRDNKSVSEILRIDSLANIHHGLCYREFNSAREWKAHNLDRLKSSDFELTFDDSAWKAALSQIPAPPPPPQETTNQGALIPLQGSIERPSCVFQSPHFH
jgi:hypothetical protein